MQLPAYMMTALRKSKYTKTNQTTNKGTQKMKEDIYGLGECSTCKHYIHNHGLGMCIGKVSCLCERFTQIEQE